MTPEVKKRIEQIRQGIVPEGYKKGKIGIVPIKWNEVPFSTLFTSTSEYTDDLKQYPLYSLTIEDGITAKTERYERSHLVKKENSYKVVRPNDYAYNPMNIRFGAVARHKGDIPVAVSGYYDIFTTVHESDLVFMDSFLTYGPMITYYNKVSTGSLVEKQRVHFSDFLEFSLALPPLEERKKIAEILSTQDKTIELQGRKIEELKRFKKGCLEKMFPRKGQKAPEKRFPGFTDNWEQRKLGELVDRVIRKNTNNESTLPLTISAQYGLVDQITYFNKRVASRDVSNYYLVLNGEFAYNKSTSDGYPFGAVKRLDLYEKGVLSTLYIVFVPKKEQRIDSDFLTVFFDTDRWHKGVSERAAEGARNHGLLNISAEDFFDIDLSVPKEVAEQKQIGAFIRQIDNLITLHQRKLEEMKKQKKALMQLLLTGIVRVQS